MPRKCTICAHRDAQKINDAIAGGSSFRYIALQNDVGFMSVSRHAENCLKIDLQAFQELQKREQKIEFGAFVQDLIFRSEKMLRATEKWLSSPTNENEFDISPRDDEMEVIYLDHNDLFMGEPKRKKAKLCDLLAIAEKRGLEAIQVNNQATDNRKLFLDSFKPIKETLDIYAKHFGEYAKDNEQKQPVSFNSITILKQQLIANLKLLNIPQSEMLEAYNQAIPVLISTRQAMGEILSAEDFRVESWELAG